MNNTDNRLLVNYPQILVKYYKILYTSTSFIFLSANMSHVMRKPDFCICKNKGADQLCGNHTADQHLYFRYIDSTIPLLPKSEISSF